MQNRAMASKVQSGEAIAVNDKRRLGPFYVLDTFEEDKDYCDPMRELWVWSIARCEVSRTFKYAGVTHVVPAGTILASLGTELYQLEGFTCLFLR